MKLKKALCIILCALLLGALLPGVSSAANGPGGVLASIVLTGGMEKCLYSGDSAVEAMILDANPQADDRYNLPQGVLYDAASNTLSLTDFAADGSTLVLTGMGSDFKISLSGSSSLAAIRSDSAGYGGSITFCGDGALALSCLSDAAIFLDADGAADFIRVEPQVRLTAASYAGSAVRVVNSTLSDGVISFDTATPDVRALDSSTEVRNALTTDGAVIDLYTLSGEAALFGLEAVIVTDVIETDVTETDVTGSDEPAPEQSGEGEEPGEPTEPVTEKRTTERLAYNVYRLGATDEQGHYEAQLEQSAIGDISAFAPYRTPHDFSLYGSYDGALCSRVRFGRFTLSAASNGFGSVSVSPTAVGRGGSAVVSYEPAEGYKLDSLLVNGVAVQAADGNYSIGSVTEDVRIEACFAEAAPVAIELSAPSQTDFAVPADGADDFVSEPFTAVVRDGAGDAVNLSVSYSLSPETAGVSIGADGRVSVANAAKEAAAAQALSFTVTAAAEGTELRAESSFTVSLAERTVSHVAISRGSTVLGASDTLTIPAAGKTATASYSAAFTDQYGDQIDEQPQWSSGTLSGVSRENGTLTLTDACADGSSLTLTASAASNSAVTASLELRFAASKLTIDWPSVTLAEEPVYGIAWEELVSLDGGSAARDGESVEGSFSLVTQNELPHISDSFRIRFSYQDENGETQTADSDEQSVTLSPKPLSADMITLSPASTPYTGAAVTPAVSLKDGTRALLRDTDFSVGEYRNNVEIGTGSVSVAGIGNYEGTVEKSFAITAIPGSAVKSSVTACKPEDTRTEPAIELTNGESTLVRGTDYDVSFRYDIPAKSGTATVTLKGIYSGTIVSRFDLPNYLIVSGANGSWSKSSTDTLSFRANGALEKFTELTVDGKTVDPSYYTTESGSTVVRIKANYLKTLSSGKHIVGVAYADGKALAIFSVTDAVRRGVATGDSHNTLVWIALMAASAIALGALGYVYIRTGRKSRESRKKR